MPRGVPSKPRDTGGSPAERMLLRRLLRRLESWEDPTRTDGVALTYRELLVEVDRAVLAGGGKVAVQAWGASGEFGDPRKQAERAS